MAFNNSLLYPNELSDDLLKLKDQLEFLENQYEELTEPVEQPAVQEEESRPIPEKSKAEVFYL